MNSEKTRRGLADLSHTQMTESPRKRDPDNDDQKGERDDAVAGDVYRVTNAAAPEPDVEASAWIAAQDADGGVGYKRPPRHSQFQPGRSGNPRGRPRGVKSLSDIVRKIVAQNVTITENGRTRRVPRIEAILLRAAGEASRGDPRALKMLLQLAERYGESAQVRAAQETMAAEDLALLDRYLPGWDESPSEASEPAAETEARG